VNPFPLGNWTVHPDRNELVSRTETRRLEPRTMALLVRLASSPGAVVTKEELLRDVWNDAHVVEHVLPKTMSALRKSLGEEARFIETVPRRGYSLTLPCGAPASPPADPAASSLPAPVRRYHWLLAAAIALAVLISVYPRPHNLLALAPTRAADLAVARDATDALAHDLTKFSCLTVTTRPSGARYRVESNVVDVAGKPVLRTRLVESDRYVAAIDTPASAGVVAASKTASAKLVKHVCKRR
jgi:DNA-binding winged helix-turn-helix (wHTH) protein